MIFVKHKFPLKLKITLNQTIQCFSGPNIGLSFGNFKELTSYTVFNV